MSSRPSAARGRGRRPVLNQWEKVRRCALAELSIVPPRLLMRPEQISNILLFVKKIEPFTTSRAVPALAVIAAGNRRP